MAKAPPPKAKPSRSVKPTQRNVSELEQQIRAVVRAIPKGKVLPYSRVAILAGIPGGARRVSRALHASEGLPWWRVVRADHTLAKEVAGAQAAKLAREGVKVSGRRLPASARATLLEVEEALAAPRRRRSRGR